MHYLESKLSSYGCLFDGHLPLFINKLKMAHKFGAKASGNWGKIAWDGKKRRDEKRKKLLLGAVKKRPVVPSSILV